MTDGLFLAETGFVQTGNGVLALEIAGTDPIADHDLVVIQGEATLDGVLDLAIADARRLPSGIAVVMVADAIIGDFDQVVTSTGREDVVVCTTDRAVVVRVGDGPIAADAAAIATVAEVLDLLDVLGSDDPAWDLDADGIVGESDLGILLRFGTTCP